VSSPGKGENRRLKAPPMPTPRHPPALVIISLLLALAAPARATAPDPSLPQPEPSTVQQLPSAAQPNAEATAPSFSQLAAEAATPPEGLQPPGDHQPTHYWVEDNTSDSYSLAWLALSGVAAATWAARTYRRRTPPWLSNNHASTSTQPALWRDDEESDAQGWRLSRIDELPDQHFTPLYDSLDDADTRASAQVIPIHRGRTASSRPSTFHHTAPIDLSIVDVEAKPIKR